MSGDAIRPVAAADLPALKGVLDETGLFPADMLDDMIAPFLRGEAPSQVWLTCEEAGTPIALAYCEPERMTAGTWNLLAIAVRPEAQGRGVGTRLVRHLEAVLAASGQRILLVETSGLPAFDRTRRFYAATGYAEEARIRDFYAEGEDKIVFRRRLRD